MKAIHYHISAIIWYNEQKWKKPVDHELASLADVSFVGIRWKIGQFC